MYSIFLFFYIDFFVFLFYFICLLLNVAYLTLIERKILSYIQKRESARLVGISGLLQPFADALKLVLKEFIILVKVNMVFSYSSSFIFFFSFVYWLILPLNFIYIFDFAFGILIFYIISSISSIFVYLAGWISKNIFSLIGLMRSVSLVFSYELLFCLVILIIFCFNSSLNFINIIKAQEFIWNVIPLFFPFLICFIVLLAETNRHPVDLGESESETVAGFFVEFSAMGFGLFFMGEYLNIFSMSSFLSIVFFGGWFFFKFFLFYILPLKIVIVSLFFIIIRGAYPRYRFDQFLIICWNSFFFFLFSFLLFIICFEFLIVYLLF